MADCAIRHHCAYYCVFTLLQKMHVFPPEKKDEVDVLNDEVRPASHFRPPLTVLLRSPWEHLILSRLFFTSHGRIVEPDPGKKGKINCAIGSGLPHAAMRRRVSLTFLQYRAISPRNNTPDKLRGLLLCFDAEKKFSFHPCLVFTCHKWRLIRRSKKEWKSKSGLGVCRAGNKSRFCCAVIGS